MAIEFFLITKQKVDTKYIPDNIPYKAQNGILIFDINMDWWDAFYFLEGCQTHEYISDIVGENYTQLHDLIKLLDLRYYVIDFTNYFGGMPDDDQYSIPVIDCKILREHISYNNPECKNTIESVLSLLGIKISDAFG